MAKKRTKAEKEGANKRRSMSYSLGEIDAQAKKRSTSRAKKNSAPAEESNIFGYSTDFIKQDLLKTIGVTAIIIALLLVITVFRSELIF